MSDPQMPENLERDLKEVFRRVEPPLGFTNRVMDRIPVKQSRPPWKRQWLTAAAAACLAIVGTSAWEARQRQAQGERAKQELIYALTVASQSLETTKHILTR